MTGTITRAKALRGDLSHWDGKTITATRVDATGGTITGLVTDNEVDVLQVFGSGTDRTYATLKSASDHVGTSTATLVLAPGTWVIGTNLTLASNLTLRVPAGCVISPESGITLTVNGVTFCETPTITGGSGTVTFTGGVIGPRRTSAEIAAGVTPTNYAYEPLPVIDLRRYGTFSDGDNITTVIQTAISVAATTNFKSIAIQFPPGRYLVNTGVFSYDSGDARVGIKWLGAGRNGTTLELQVSGASQVYFFANSGAVTYRDSYHGIRFLGADVTYCNGWQLNDSATWEKQFHFWDCRFEDLNNVLYPTGTTNADECVFFGCEWYDIRTLVRLDNLQSMLHHFYGCTGTFIGDLIVLEDGGGGEVHYHGGGLIQIPETTVDTYWVRGDAGPATGLSTGNITFNKTRSEQRTQYAKLIYWPVSDSTNRSRQVRIAFDNVNLSQAIQSSGTTRDDWILIGEGKWVVFERCTFPAIASGTLDDVEMTITADNSGAPGVVNPGMITLRDCQVPLDIASNCVITNRYGRFEATGCIPTGTDAADDRTVVNFSKGWATSTQGVSNAPTHRASFLRYSWPLSDGGGGFTGEMTITLPAGAVVTKVSLYKPAQGTASATTQYFISSDDKGTNYCSSTSGRADALHTAVEDDPATLPAGPLAADTVFRLHQTGTSTLIQTGGYAFIEYV